MSESWEMNWELQEIALKRIYRVAKSWIFHIVVKYWNIYCSNQI